jgi:type IV secretion system protein VirB10
MNEVARMDRRRAVIEGGPSGDGRRLLAGTSVIFLLGAGAFFVLTAGIDNEAGAPDTSETADMQDEAAWTGVDTRMPLTAPEKAPQAQLVAMMPPPVQTPEVDDDDKAARAHIADLERQIQALRDAQGEHLDVRAVLEDQRAMLEEQFRSEREAAEERYQRQLAEMARNMAGGVGAVRTNDDGRDAQRRLEEERARQAAIAEAQIMSDGIVLDASGAVRGNGSQGEAGGRKASERRLSSNEAFIRDASTQSSETVRATRIAAPGRTIVQGTTVAAVLETAISTELPGVIRAVVSDDVLSYDGNNVLLPRGTRLIGSYNSAGSVVQGRVQIGWNRAVTPEGVSVELGGYGADALGGSGQAGFVDSRFWQRFGSAALISLIGAGSEVIVVPGASAIQQNTAEDLGDDIELASRGVTDEYLSLPPVIHVDQGTAVTVFVNRDLVL